MRNITKKLEDSTRGSNLYCVWVPVHDDAGNRLVAIWIDRAMTAFKSCAPQTLDGIGPDATHLAEPQEEDVNLFDAEHLTFILPRHV
jgi:hypothetical protein